MEKILIAEDDKASRELIKIGLEKADGDYEIHVAVNGREAIEIFKKESISLLVTDIKMPEIDGFGVLSYVINEYKSIPCIVITAHIQSQKEFELYIKALQPDIKKMLIRDSLYFYSKPFNIKDFTDTVAEALKQAAAGPTSRGISVASFMHLIELEQTTCCLEMKLTNGETGSIHFVDGIPYNASFGALEGEEAFYGIINSEKPKIHMKNEPHQIEEVPKQIYKNLSSLILEAVKLKGESG